MEFRHWFVPNVTKLKNKKDIEGLIRALDYKKDPGIREAAAKALGEIGDASAVKPLIQVLRDEDNNVRYQAARALVKIRDARAVDPLNQAVKDENGWVRMHVETALRECQKRKV